MLPLLETVTSPSIAMAITHDGDDCANAILSWLGAETLSVIERLRVTVPGANVSITPPSTMVAVAPGPEVAVDPDIEYAL